jgi:hypothetical protein
MFFFVAFSGFVVQSALDGSALLVAAPGIRTSGT